MQAPVKPLRVFRDVHEFVLRHKAGTEAEFEASQKIVDSINKQEIKLKAWVWAKTRETPKRLEYLVVVQPGPDGERKIPQQGEPAKLRVVFGDDTATRFVRIKSVSLFPPSSRLWSHTALEAPEAALPSNQKKKKKKKDKTDRNCCSGMPAESKTPRICPALPRGAARSSRHLRSRCTLPMHMPA